MEHLSLGFVLKISIEPKNTEINLEDYKNLIFDSLDELLDYKKNSSYDLTIKHNNIYITLNNAYFQYHIKDFLKETSNYLSSIKHIKNDTFTIEKRLEDEIPYIKVISRNAKSTTFYPNSPLENLLYLKLESHIKDIRKKFSIFVNYFTIWTNIDECEKNGNFDETLKTINLLNKNLITNPLSNILYFY